MAFDTLYLHDLEQCNCDSCDLFREDHPKPAYYGVKHYYPYPPTNFMSVDFQECDACRAKPGTPVLCSGCLHNRTLISKLMSDLNDAQLEHDPNFEEPPLPNPQAARDTATLVTLLGQVHSLLTQYLTLCHEITTRINDRLPPSV